MKYFTPELYQQFNSFDVKEAEALRVVHRQERFLPVQHRRVRAPAVVVALNLPGPQVQLVAKCARVYLADRYQAPIFPVDESSRG